MNPDDIAPGHNPDKLTRAQVGDGFRLITEGERMRAHRLRYHMDGKMNRFVVWGPSTKWDRGNGLWAGAYTHLTFRAPLLWVDDRPGDWLPEEREIHERQLAGWRTPPPIVRLRMKVADLKQRLTTNQESNKTHA